MRFPLYLFAGLVVTAVLSAAVRRPSHRPMVNSDLPRPSIEVPSCLVGPKDSIRIRSVGGGGLLISSAAYGPFQEVGADHKALPITTDQRRTERLVTIPTAIPWKHPYPGQPSAMVLRVAEVGPAGRQGPVEMFTGILVDHAGMPIISLLAPEDAFFDPDTGIYVVGNAVMHPTPEMMLTQQEDGRWWKYPGNYHFRGREWERHGLVQFIDGNGVDHYQAPVRLRANGQMTRGFPQHALRLLFDEPVPVEVIGDDRGAVAYVLRAAGNDQMKAMMRDALAHALCDAQPFEVANARTCAVYVNGAYWGVHQLRPRMDEKELARRAEVRPKEIALVEVRSRMLVGKEGDVAELRETLEKIVSMAKGPDFMEKVEQDIDLDAFLHYMACVLILDNQDWPHNNVKIWRYTGKDSGDELRDGRWRFILNDMDLGLGAYGSADLPLFDRIKGNGPVPDLFRALMGSVEVRDRFDRIVDGLLSGPFSPAISVARLDAMMQEMAPEMPRHIARWRQPSSIARWKAEVDRIRTFLTERPRYVGQRARGSLP